MYNGLWVPKIQHFPKRHYYPLRILFDQISSVLLRLEGASVSAERRGFLTGLMNLAIPVTQVTIVLLGANTRVGKAEQK